MAKKSRGRGGERRMLGPGVVRRRPEGRGDAILVERHGERRGEESAPPAAARPEFDPELALSGAGGQRRVHQWSIPAGVAMASDLVLSKDERPVRWKAFARGVRQRNWHSLERISRGRFGASVAGAELRVRALEARPAETGASEVAWRLSLRNVPAPKSRDLFVRVVVELAA